MATSPPTPDRKPQYPDPNNNINVAARNSLERVIALQARFTGTPPASFPAWPTRADADKIEIYVNQLAQVNAYVPQSGSNISIKFDWLNPTSFFQVDYSTAGGTGAKSGKIIVPSLIEIINDYRTKYGTRAAALGVLPELTDYDHIVIFAFTGGGRFMFATDKFVIVPPLAQPPATKNRDLGLREIAAAITHEMGHGYGMSHAQSIRDFWPPESLPPGADPLVPYGDIFDYMGGMTQSRHRFNVNCYSGVPLPARPWPAAPACPSSGNLFADPGDIHTHPVRKLQHRWLTIDSIQRVTQNGTYSVKPITSSSGIRALQIESYFDVYGAPMSLFIYFRDNECLARTGASLSYASREWVAAESLLVEFDPGMSITPAMGCRHPTRARGEWGPSPYHFPSQKATLLPNQQPAKTFVDAVTGATITCLSVSATELKVQVSGLPAAGNPVNFRNLPIVAVISPELSSGRVITKNDKVRIMVDAADPDVPGRQAWQGMQKVKLEVFTAGQPGTATRPEPVILESFANQGQLIETEIISPSTEWLVDAGDLWDPRTSPTIQIPIVRKIGLRVRAFSAARPMRFTEGIVDFLLDQR